MQQIIIFENLCNRLARKPSIDEKIEAVMVRAFLENGLGYKSGTSGEDEDVVERAL